MKVIVPLFSSPLFGACLLAACILLVQPGHGVDGSSGGNTGSDPTIVKLSIFPSWIKEKDNIEALEKVAIDHSGTIQPIVHSIVDESGKFPTRMEIYERFVKKICDRFEKMLNQLGRILKEKCPVSQDIQKINDFYEKSFATLWKSVEVLDGLKENLELEEKIKDRIQEEIKLHTALIEESEKNVLVSKEQNKGWEKKWNEDWKNHVTYMLQLLEHSHSLLKDPDFLQHIKYIKKIKSDMRWINFYDEQEIKNDIKNDLIISLYSVIIGTIIQYRIL